MMMRLAFAVAACVEPDVLIVDEALAVGDMAFQQKCFARIEEVKHRGTTILFVSHDIYMVRTYCERAIYLQSGRKIMDGNAETVTEAYLKDVIAERQTQTPASIMWKANPRVGVAGFGGDLGEIVSAEFLSRDRGPGITAVTYGDEIGLRVKARVDPQVRNPTLFCQIRDYSGYAISGINSSLMGIQFSDQEREDGEIGWVVWWPVVLSPGPYTFTLGLNDYVGQAVNVVVDKQVGVCPFTVLDSQMHFHGAADLKAQLEKADLYETLDDLRTSRRKVMEPTRVEAHELRQISERYFGWHTSQFSRWWEYPWVANRIAPHSGMQVLMLEQEVADPFSALSGRP
jgi:lipopolysaccharide transport system ATP-binding protein